VRAGVNWGPGVVGHAKLPANEGSAAGYALQTCEPVISENVATETRLQIPMLLTQHGVKSTVNALIRGEDKPFGILEVDSRQLRSFAQDDVDFLQNYANLLSSAIKRVNAQARLAESAQHERVLRHELQHRINNMLTTIRALARRTRARSQSLDHFAKSFDDRLAAIARTHTLLSRTETSAVEMRELLAQACAIRWLLPLCLFHKPAHSGPPTRTGPCSPSPGFGRNTARRHQIQAVPGPCLVYGFLTTRRTRSWSRSIPRPCR
jgi:hypothetical protein